MLISIPIPEVNRFCFSIVFRKALWLCSFDSICHQIDTWATAKLALSMPVTRLP